VSADGLWQLDHLTIRVRVGWVGSSFTLSFSEYPDILDISSLLETVKGFPVLDARSSSVAKVGLEEMLQIKIKEMRAKMNDMAAGNDFLLLNATGQAAVADFGAVDIRFLLVYPDLPKSLTRVVTDKGTRDPTPSGYGRPTRSSDPSSVSEEDEWIETDNDAIAILVSNLDVRSVNLSELVNKYNDIDVSKFPFIRSYTTFGGILMVSSAVLSTQQLHSLGWTT
jgi:hypothetical protein